MELTKEGLLLLFLHQGLGRMWEKGKEMLG